MNWLIFAVVLTGILVLAVLGFVFLNRRRRRTVQSAGDAATDVVAQAKRHKAAQVLIDAAKALGNSNDPKIRAERRALIKKAQQIGLSKSTRASSRTYKALIDASVNRVKEYDNETAKLNKKKEHLATLKKELNMAAEKNDSARIAKILELMKNVAR